MKEKKQAPVVKLSEILTIDYAQLPAITAIAMIDKELLASTTDMFWTRPFLFSGDEGAACWPGDPTVQLVLSKYCRMY